MSTYSYHDSRIHGTYSRVLKGIASDCKQRRGPGGDSRLRRTNQGPLPPSPALGDLPEADAVKVRDEPRPVIGRINDLRRGRVRQASRLTLIWAAAAALHHFAVPELR